MRNFIATLGLATIALLSTGSAALANNDEDNRDKAKRVFLVSDFRSVSVSSGIDLYLQQGEKSEAIAYAPKNIMDDLVIERNGSQLEIKFKKGVRIRFGNDQSVKVYLTFKDLESVSASGGSDVEMARENAMIKANTFKVYASGGADVDLNLTVESLFCVTSGGSDVELVGSANYAKIECSGGSDFKGTKFEVKKCEVYTSGGSDAYVYASESIKASASGASDIYYYGNPKSKNVSTSGASDIYSR